MNRTELEQNIVKALENNPFCSFSTVENGKPKSRYMALFNDGMNIHLATNRRTHKVEELENNPNVSLLLGYESGGSKEVVEVEGTCEITKNEALREQVWNDELKAWFDGPQDPNYVILDITPTRIEYTGKDHEHQVWEQ
ncbi:MULTISPECIES: pyridoxamine 5'-phosphate oxidase family protein [Paenibacillus]|uniref:General stress protein 26 n=2 Tax=Paenibacillus TaxID=44249 RepID=A0AAP5H4P6_PAEAM|nr:MULTISPECIES: pyridoxamine 5'-phosphate oxidase family protein [Paenibacillus]MCG7379282.1 pyridoxamine 5'-phosphate oxidase family protein [Paenibacillus sp. ACRSA]MDQ0172277.1 general stress protein 26 [Paenibacillus tundrae]MDR6724693.1 general stress protein 26 [Paenibacillus amylolyticus]